MKQTQEKGRRGANTKHQGQGKAPETPQTPIPHGPGTEPRLAVYEFPVMSKEAAQRPWTDSTLFFLPLF